MIDLESLRVGFAFSLGTATFFAPCAVPLLPGYVAFFIGRESDAGARPLPSRLRRALGVALVTSLGFFAVFGVLFGIVTAIGAGALQDIAVLELVVGILLIVLGGAMALDRFDADLVHVQLPERRRGPAGYFAFGVVYAVAAAGCTAPAFIGIATVGLSGGPSTAIAVFTAYAAGMSVLLVGVTLLAAIGRDALVQYLVSNTRLVTRLAGLVLVVAGVVQIYWFLFVFDGLRMLG
jgi:cytochrome c-type biogenesis protein